MKTSCLFYIRTKALLIVAAGGLVIRMDLVCQNFEQLQVKTAWCNRIGLATCLSFACPIITFAPTAAILNGTWLYPLGDYYFSKKKREREIVTAVDENPL